MTTRRNSESEFPSWFFAPQQMFHVLLFPTLIWYMVIWSVVVPVLLIMVLWQIVVIVFRVAMVIYSAVKQARESE